MILQQQALELSKQTNGLLVGEVKIQEQDGMDLAALDVFAPLLNYRHRVLVVGYKRNIPYPAIVEAESLTGEHAESEESLFGIKKLFDRNGEFANIAESESSFVTLISDVLSSAELVGLMNGLIARINEYVDEVEKSDEPNR